MLDRAIRQHGRGERPGRPVHTPRGTHRGPAIDFRRSESGNEPSAATLRIRRACDDASAQRQRAVPTPATATILVATIDRLSRHRERRGILMLRMPGPGPAAKDLAGSCRREAPARHRTAYARCAHDRGTIRDGGSEARRSRGADATQARNAPKDRYDRPRKDCGLQKPGYAAATGGVCLLHIYRAGLEHAAEVVERVAVFPGRDFHAGGASSRIAPQTSEGHRTKPAPRTSAHPVRAKSCAKCCACLTP